MDFRCFLLRCSSDHGVKFAGPSAHGQVRSSVNKPSVLEATADKNSIQNSIIASSMIMASTPLVSKAVEDTYEYGAGEYTMNSTILSFTNNIRCHENTKSTHQSDLHGAVSTCLLIDVVILLLILFFKSWCLGNLNCCCTCFPSKRRGSIRRNERKGR